MNKQKITGILISIITLTLFNTACNNESSKYKTLNTVEKVEVEKYLGKWYEIASIPMKEQAGCVGTNATYSLKSDGTIKVFNECRVNKLDGEIKNIEGSARIFDQKSKAKLKVSFFWPFEGDYWVLDLGKNYEYALVGNPTRNYAWILSRTPQMDENTYQTLLEKLKQQEYDITRIKKTLQ